MEVHESYRERVKYVHSVTIRNTEDKENGKSNAVPHFRLGFIVYPGGYPWVYE